jgi:hypothetical protein
VANFCHTVLSGSELAFLAVGSRLFKKLDQIGRDRCSLARGWWMRTASLEQIRAYAAYCRELAKHPSASEDQRFQIMAKAIALEEIADFREETDPPNAGRN